MADLHIYRQGELLPPHFHFQAEAAVRIIFDFSTGGMDAQSDPKMMHVVIANGLEMLAYTGIISTSVELEGASYTCFGLSGVLTFPAVRRQGYGKQLIGAATELIREQPSADIGLLWTATHNVRHYTQHGWELMPNMTTCVGDPAHPTPHNDEERLMLFLSEKGQRARPTFEDAHLYVGEESW